MKHSNIAFFIPHVGCPNKCSFCNQNSISGAKDVPRQKDIIDTLSFALKNMSADKLKYTEIAFFGGSFTAINKDYMLELLSAAKQFVGKNKFSGIRISTRPDAIDDDILLLLKEYGVTAIELGAQSMCDEVLEKNFRGHSSLDVVNASDLIKKHGFSLGLQMMTGLYLDTPQKSIETARKIADLKPDTVRIYPTVVIKGTYLEQLYNEGKYCPLDVEKTVELCARLLDFFDEKNIKVIRVGLHDQPSLKEDFVSGAYHPALGELIMGERMFRKTLLLIKEANIENGMVNVAVNPRSVSQFVGQSKCNINKLLRLGFDINYTTDNSLKLNEIKLI